MSHSDQRRSSFSEAARRRPDGLAWIVTVLGLALSAGLFFLLYQEESNRLGLEFKVLDRERALKLSEDLRLLLDGVDVLSDSLRTHLDQDEQEFASIAAPILRRSNNILSLQWAPRVSNDERAQFEAPIQAAGKTETRILEVTTDGKSVPAATRAEYFPVQYMVSVEGGGSAIGFDHASNIVRRAAMLRAVAMHQSNASSRQEQQVGRTTFSVFAATPLVVLPSVPDQLPRVIVYSPVYRIATGSKDKDTDANQPAGFCIATINPQGVLDHTLKIFKPAGIHMALLDGPNEDKPLALHLSRLSSGATWKASELTPALPEGRFYYAHPIPFCGRQWQLVFISASAFEARHRSNWSWAALSIGCVLAGLGEGFVRYHSERKRELVLRVEERTHELTAAHAVLQAREQDLAITLRSIGDAVLSTDAQGHVSKMNPVAEQLTGWIEAEARNRPVGEIFHIINEETRQPALIPVDDVLATGEIHGLANQTVLIARDSTERAIEDCAAPIRDGAGVILGVVLVFRDATKERTNRKRIDVLLKDLQDFKSALDEHTTVALTDAQGKITSCNDRFCSITKYTRAELIGQDHRIMNSGHHPQEFFRELWTTISQGRVWKGEIMNRARDGSHYWMDSTIVPFLNAAGQPYQYVAIRTDITERKLADDEIRTLNTRVQKRAAQLEEANKELEAFSYSVSHDLRAPIRHIEGYVELLGKQLGENPSEKARRYMKTIADTTKEMGQLIDDLLSFSRMGRAEMQEQSVDLNQMLVETIDGQESETKGRNIIWKNAILPPVRADPAMLKQVMVNLLANAIKYTRRRDPAEIETGVMSETDKEVVVFVRDNGAGFDMKYADKLFGVFQRLHRADEFEGTGIGLANVRCIITRHGGRIWAEAEVDKGATFYFSINKVFKP
jgi:PAS domain S-box-containing protein